MKESCCTEPSPRALKIHFWGGASASSMTSTSPDIASRLAVASNFHAIQRLVRAFLSRKSPPNEQQARRKMIEADQES